jgi:dTMP kinase
MGRGTLFALEGVDGSGKSTQARLLAVALKKRGLAVVLTGEPSRGPLGKRLRDYLKGSSRAMRPQEELDLFMADRRQHVEEVINPALAAGKVVISDRYYYSSAAYQGALGLDPAKIVAANESFAPRPDLVFILTLPVPRALSRLAAKSARSRQVTENPAYLERVAAIYAALRGPHIYPVDATETPEGVHAVILRQARKALGDRLGPSAGEDRSTP